MSNILTIQLGSLKLDIPLDKLPEMAKKQASEAKPRTIITPLAAPQTELFAMPEQTDAPATPFFRTTSEQHRVAEFLMAMRPGATKFYKAKDQRRVSKIFMNTAVRLRERGQDIQVSTKRGLRNDKPGIFVTRVK
jgi:hypothetical protein